MTAFIVTDHDDKDRACAIVDVLPIREAADRLVAENGYGVVEEWESAEDCLIPDLEYFIQSAMQVNPIHVRADAMAQYAGWLPKETIQDVLNRNA